MTDFSEGQHVTVTDPKFQGVYLIAGTGPVNFKLYNVAGGSRLNVPKAAAHRWLRPATAEQVQAAQAARPDVQPDLGTVVLYHNPKATGLLHVVIKLHADGSFNLAQLGGADGGRYWAKVRPLSVTVVPAAEIEEAYRKAAVDIS